MPEPRVGWGKTLVASRLAMAIETRSTSGGVATTVPLSAGRPFARPVTSGGTMAVLLQRNLGLLILAIFLVLYGLAGMVALGLPPIVLAVLALVAGILILIGR